MNTLKCNSHIDFCIKSVFTVTQSKFEQKLIRIVRTHKVKRVPCLQTELQHIEDFNM